MARYTLLSILGLALASSAFAAGPKAIPVEPIMDFETVNRGTLIRHVFEIRNGGTETLEIGDVRPACGCTVVDFDKTVAAGGVGRIVTTVKTDEFSGPISKSIAVFTNDRENPKLQLVIKANIKMMLSAKPGFARYNYVQGEPAEAVRQTLWANDNEDLEIVDIKIPNKYLTVTKRVANADEYQEGYTGKQWILDIGIEPDAPIGALRGHIIVGTDHAGQKNVKIPISGFVRPRQHITPQKLDFGRLQSDALPVRRSLHFTNFIEAQITATRIESEIPGLSAEVRDANADEGDKGHRFRLVVTLDEDAPKGPFKGMLKIHISDPKNPIVVLQVNGTVI